MPRIRFDAFAGDIPKFASHLLPEKNSQASMNAKVDSGMLTAWNESSKIENTTVSDPLSLYKYIQDSGATEDWFVSAEDLDFVENPQGADEYERVYFAGSLSTDVITDTKISGTGVDGYDSSTGLITLTSNLTPGDINVGDWVKDTDTDVEYLITAHDLTGGAGADTITIQSGPSVLSATIDIMENVYFPPNYGEKEIRFFANDMDGVEDWDGNEHYNVLGIEPPNDEPAPWVDTGAGGGRNEGTNDYSYVYTYVNSYGEEGPPSDPTDATSINTVDPVYVQVKPPFGLGNNEAEMPEEFHYDITKVKLYRTEAGVTTADFLFVKEQNVSSIENPLFTNEPVTGYVPATGVITMTNDFTAGDIDPTLLHYVKDLDNDRYYRVTAVSLGGGAGTDTITIGDAKPLTLSSNIDFYEWVMEDDVLIDDLGDVLASTGYFPPPAGLLGLTSMTSGHLYSWKDNVLYYSEPFIPNAWPVENAISIERQIVVARGFANTLCIATDGQPYVFSGQSPRTFNKLRIGKWMPCLSKRATTTLDDSILYPTREGLINLGRNGAANVTKKMIRREQWISYVMGNAFALYRNDRYFAFPNNDVMQGFILDFNDNEFLPLSLRAECGYLTPDDGVMFFVSIDPSEGLPGVRRSIKQWQGDALNFVTYTWKSKKVVLPRNVNMGVARIELDDDFYAVFLALAEENEYLRQQNDLLFAESATFEDVGYDSYVSGTGIITLTDDFVVGSVIPGVDRIKDTSTEKDYPIDSVDLGNGAGADTITIDVVSGAGGEDSPPSSLSNPFDIIRQRDLGGEINGGNSIIVEGRTLDRYTINGDLLFDLNSITVSPWVTLKIWADGVLQYQKNVLSTKAFKLPKGFKGKRWEIEMSSTVPVRRFDMATTMKELITS